MSSSENYEQTPSPERHPHQDYRDLLASKIEPEEYVARVKDDVHRRLGIGEYRAETRFAAKSRSLGQRMLEFILRRGNT